MDVVPSKFAEDLPKCEASDYVRGTARSKAEEVAGRLAADGRRTLLVAADTVVVLDGHILEKPADAEHARNMIRSLSGRSHDVFTGT